MVREGIAARPEDEANVGVFELDAAAADALSRIQEHVGDGGDGKRLREPLGMRDGTDGRHVDRKAGKAPARRRARAARRVVVARADARTSSADLAERCGERPDGPDRRLAVAGPLGPPAEHDHRPVRRKLLSEIPDRLLVEPADAGRPGGVADDAVKTSVEPVVRVSRK